MTDTLNAASDQVILHDGLSASIQSCLIAPAGSPPDHGDGVRRTHTLTWQGGSLPTAISGARVSHAGSAPEGPRDHGGELGLPERIAVVPDPLGHHDVRAGIAQRVRPPGRVLEEPRLERAGDEIRPR